MKFWLLVALLLGLTAVGVSTDDGGSGFPPPVSTDDGGDGFPPPPQK